MHPLSTLETPARLSAECDKIASIGYIQAHRFDNSPFGQFAAKAAERKWWRADLTCGHIAMLDEPGHVALLLTRGPADRKVTARLAACDHGVRGGARR
jgi:hypothetical protein